MDVNLELQVGRFYLNAESNIVHIIRYDSSKIHSFVDHSGRRYRKDGKANHLNTAYSLIKEYNRQLEDDSAVEALHVSEPKENTMITDWLSNYGNEEISKQVNKELVGLHFPEIIEERIKKIQDTLAAKAKEYATDGQSFYNFDRAAEINRTSAKKSLWGMATKHLVSVIDMVEQDKSFDEAYIDEKIGDMVNYLILLEGLLKRDSEE